MCNVADCTCSNASFVIWALKKRQVIRKIALIQTGYWLLCDNARCNSYVYWTAHHLDSWIKRDQLDVTCFIISLFTAQHVSDVNASILRSLRLICWVISWVVLFWFDVCWCYGVVWLGWCGIRMQASACIRIPHIEPEQYNPWNNSTNKSQAPEDGCINIGNMLSSK